MNTTPAIRIQAFHTWSDYMIKTNSLFGARTRTEAVLRSHGLTHLQARDYVNSRLEGWISEFTHRNARD